MITSGGMPPDMRSSWPAFVARLQQGGMSGAPQRGDDLWRPRLRDLAPPVYVYTWQETVRWDMHHVRGMQMPAVQPWSFPAYRGPAVKPARIGVTR